ncbi:MAG: hypothetical protein ACRD16_11535 [Thermoanaerobaculia bacterium]
MAHGIRILLLSAVLATPVLGAGNPIPAVASNETRIVRLGSTAGNETSFGQFDYCLKDPSNGAVFRFNASTGSYVACGADGTFEQGTGIVTSANGMITLSRMFLSNRFPGLESAHATVNTATGVGSAYLNASSETQASFKAISINDPNVNDNSDCSSCAAESGINEGTINTSGLPDHAFPLSSNATQYAILQKYSLNSDFGGSLTRLVGGLSRNGAGGLSFQFVVHQDNQGKPAESPVYESPVFQYSDFPAFPVIGIVQQNVSLNVGPTFWAGWRLNPSTNPTYFPFDSAATSPASDVYGCEAASPCQKLVVNPAIRGLFLSADSQYQGRYQTGGLVRYAIPGTTDIVSDKCDAGYEQINLGSQGIYQLYAESGPSDSFPARDYSGSFARIRRIGSAPGTGLDGVAETRYGTTRFSAFSYIGGNQWNFCTRPLDATDFVCHSIPGFQAGSGGYTRIAGVQNGLEASYANAPADQIYRTFLQYNGSGWTSQTRNPVQATPSIGSPEFGFNWYQARSFKLGVAYEYKTTSGAIEAQVLSGNTVVGKYAIDTDDPPAGFNPNLATRMGGDCTRDGLCIFGRFDLHTGMNVADVIDFRESPVEKVAWLLGPGAPGFGFGRTLQIDGRDGNALYGSYSTSATPNQYKLQLDYLDLETYTKFTLGYDFAAGAGNFPLGLSREGASFGLGHAIGVSTLYSLTAECGPANFKGRGSGSGSSETRVPCDNIPPVNLQNRF